MSTASMEPGHVVADRFQIERLAGTGGMGDVFAACDRETGERVALKVLHGPGARHAPRFAREATVLAELRHPAIVRHIAHGQTPSGQLWLAMEWLEGMDVARRITRSGMSVQECVTLALRVAEALGAAHDKGIIHRDVKPSNLMLVGGEVENVKLLDFGIARLTGGTATLTGVTFGTPGYMAPEQARGDRELDAAADVFALGCVLFECLTGRGAFAGEHVMAVLAKIVLADAPRVRDLAPTVPRSLDRLVWRMLAKNPEHRPRDGRQLAAELAALGPLAAPPPTGSSPPESMSMSVGEQKLLCVVLAGDPGAQATTAMLDTTSKEALEETPLPAPAARIGTAGRPPPLGTATLGRIREAVELCDAHVELLADGSVIATLTGGRNASDQAAEAARCALAMRQQLPHSTIVVTTGRGVLAGVLPVGEAIDRAVRLLREPPGAPLDAASPVPVRIDDVTAGLLDLRFEVGGDANGLLLRGEREAPETGRTLMGKQTPFVGREREMATLESLYDESVSEPMARAVLLTAPAGVGKSRLAHELRRKLRERGAEVWLGRADPLSAGSPFGLAASALRRLTGVGSGEPLGVRRRKLHARVGRHLSGAEAARVTEFLGELAGVPFPDEDRVELRAARQDAMLMGDQIRRAWEDFLAAECAAQPIVIILEDLQWGDLPSVKLVDAALRLHNKRPLFVVAVARPEVHELFPRLWAERRVQEIPLGELGKKASERLVRHVLGEDAAAQMVGKLVEHGGGNAFYLEELIRATAEGRGDKLPETVLAMVQARLEGLGADARWVLRAASVFGQAFWHGGVLELLGGADARPTLDHCLAALVEREVIDGRQSGGRFPGEREYRFRHALVRETAYAMLTEADRRLGHRLAGEWLERAGETEAITLAEHLDRGGQPARAVRWYRRASAQAVEGNDLAAAVSRTRRGIACGASGDELAALLLLAAEAHRWRGEHADAHGRALEATRVAGAGTARWYVAVSELALATVRLGSYEPLVELTTELEAPPADTALTRRYVVTLGRVAVGLLYGGRYEPADRLIARIDRHEAAIGAHDPAALAVVHRVRATRAVGRGDPAGYLAGVEAAASCFEQAGDLRNACNARVNVGHATMELGAYARAERALRDALATAERMHLPAVTALAKHNLGLVLARRGSLDLARATEQEAIDACAAQKDRRLEGGSRVYLALILGLAGHLEQAEREASAAIELVRNNDGLCAYALGALATIRVAAGTEALAPSREAMALLERAGGIEEGESLVRLAHAEALHAAGERDAAKAAITAARARLVERANKISDPVWRASFLERVPENARTTELWRSWCG